MTAPPTDDPSRFARYRLPVGLGLLVVGALVLLLVRGTVLDDAASGDMALQKPPLPAPEVELAENELIEQAPVNLDASLDLSASTPDGATTARDE